MNTNSNITIPLKFDLGQFVHLFSQLSQDNKAKIMEALQSAMKTNPTKTTASRLPLKGTVINYISPFEPVAENDWEAIS